MGSVVKKVAPIALMAAGGYAAHSLAFAGGGTALSSSFPTLLTTAGGKGIAAGGGFLSSLGSSLGGNVVSKAGLLLQAGSQIQSRRYQSSQANLLRAAQESQNKANERANKYRQLVQRREKLAQLRQGRIARGQTEAAGTNAGLGVSGTSPVMGSIGAASSQISANIGNINVAQDVGNQISQMNTMTANYQTGANQAQSNANMWSKMDTLGDTLLTEGDRISNLFNIG